MIIKEIASQFGADMVSITSGENEILIHNVSHGVFEITARRPSLELIIKNYHPTGKKRDMHGIRLDILKSYKITVMGTTKPVLQNNTTVTKP